MLELRKLARIGQSAQRMRSQQQVLSSGSCGGNILDLGASPSFTVDVIEENPTDELARRIRAGDGPYVDPNG